VRPHPHRLALAALLPVVAACGGLDAPDLSTGEVSGRLANAQPGAYAYVLGAPATKTAVVNGAFRLEGIPVGNAQIVVYDGASKAEALAVEVKAASRVGLARDAADMPLAGSVVPVPRCSGGASTEGAHFSVEGTDLQNVQLEPGQPLYPLPAGEYSLRGAQPGFLVAAKPVKVEAGASVTEEVELSVDDHAERKGCLAAGACEVGLVCKDDGRCYELAGPPDCIGQGFCSDQLQAFWSECAVGSDTCQKSALDQGLCYPTSGLVGRCTVKCASNADCPTAIGLHCDAVDLVCVK
jgi:hypothetical protein